MFLIQKESLLARKKIVKKIKKNLIIFGSVKGGACLFQLCLVGLVVCACELCFFLLKLLVFLRKKNVR